MKRKIEKMSLETSSVGMGYDSSILQLPAGAATVKDSLGKP